MRPQIDFRVHPLLWQRSVETPFRVPLVLRGPMEEERLNLYPGKIQRWLLWESDPPAVQFRLGTPKLAPAGKK